MSSNADTASRYNKALHALKEHESMAVAGNLSLRFFDPEQGVDRPKQQYLHVSFASLRQRPRYTAIYLEGQRSDADGDQDFPFYVSDLILDRCAVPVGTDVDHTKSMKYYTSWQLAVHLATAFHRGIVMERLQYAVTDVPGAIRVHGADRLYDDIMDTQTRIVDDQDDAGGDDDDGVGDGNDDRGSGSGDRHRWHRLRGLGLLKSSAAATQKMIRIASKYKVSRIDVHMFWAS